MKIPQKIQQKRKSKNKMFKRNVVDLLIIIKNLYHFISVLFSSFVSSFTKFSKISLFSWA